MTDTHIFYKSRIKWSVAIENGEYDMKHALWISILSSALTTLSLNAYAEWQCYVVDQGGHYWTSPGSTQERATAVALSFCSAYSPNGHTCHMSKCLEK